MTADFHLEYCDPVAATSEGFTRVSGTDRGRVHVVKSEREVFEFAGLEYLPPEERA